MLMKQQRAEDAVRVWIFHGSRAVHVIHTVWSAEQTNSFKPVETLSSTVLWISGTAAIGVRTFVIYSVTRVARRWARVGEANTWGEKQSHNGKLEKICLFKSPQLIGVSLGIREVGIICGRGKTWERGEKVEGQRKAGGKGNCWWLYLRNDELDRWWWW